MREMPAGGYIEGNSVFHRMDAFVKLLCTFLLLASVIACRRVLDYVLLLLVMGTAVFLSGIGLSHALGGIRRLWLFFLVIFLMNVFFSESGAVLWSWWIFRISDAGAKQGLQVIVHVVFAMVLGNLLIATTSPLEITGAIETLLSPLRYVGVPVQDAAMILGVAIQFIPIFSEEAEMIRKAQTARGAQFESRKLTEKAKSVLPLVIPIFLSAFRRADELSVAMEARGYHRTGKKKKYQKRNIQLRDLALLACCSLLCLLLYIL